MTLPAVGLGVVLGLMMLFTPAPATGQVSKRPVRIGVLHEGYFPNPPPVEGLKDGLKALGIEEGRAVTFDIRFARGDHTALPVAAAALASARVDLIFSIREEATQAAKTATRAIPIVFVRVGDPVATGIVTSVARPGGNVTGVSSLSTELAPKRLEILKALVPTLRRVWAVHHADDRSAAAAARKAAEFAPSLHLEVLAQPVRTSEELVSSLKALRAGDGLLAPAARAINIPGLILDLARASGVPAVFDAAFWVEAGAMVSYGSDESSDGAQAARLVARILGGVRPRDLPVEDANKIELALNVKTARSLGVTIPQEILARADRVIQ